MYIVYCDDSKSDSKKKQFMTAIILKDQFFKVTEGYLGWVIQRFVPEDMRETFEFHSAELFNRRPPFDAIPEHYVSTIFSCCIEALAGNKVPVIYSCLDVGYVQKGMYGSAKPIDVTFRMILPEIERWFAENAPDELGIVICDDFKNDTPLKTALQNSYELKRNKVITDVVEENGKLISAKELRGELEHLHDAMYFGNSGHSRGLQLADVCGFFINRHFSGRSDTEPLYKELEPMIFARKHEPDEKQ